ncbi:fatty acid desaturase [Streptomyces cellostaticus]|uniref:Fatty acid desaturase n=1 Tax=Streptomyces cellostaticus TaxID=67285 RepID=A0A101NDY7_9ACTN|nr:acyl-CoA desaturase [Streptomyces cellostaticus]KUM91187.1 fatty acid desaturase [Streptomyces cellostaticus]GHI02738.1 fatty acid desaturase [Streptomyces cellostaticus]
MRTSDKPNPRLTLEQLDALARDLDAIREAVIADLGTRDAAHIRRMMRLQGRLELTGRALLYLGFLPPVWLAAVACLAISSLLNREEIGHNVLHGQYDWMGDPALNSQTFEWGSLGASKEWRHSHNYVHHTFTNVLGKDRDIGYGIMRLSREQKWHPYYLGNPLYAALLMPLLDWGFAFHDLEVDRLVRRERTWSQNREIHRRLRRKIGIDVLREYVLFPALTGPLFLSTLAANACAKVLRDLWTSAIIFCGHFPDGVATFTEGELANETRGHWYYRQLLGTANISGGRLFQIMSGHLSHQIEHHLFPDLPSPRYPQIAPQVRAVCEKYGLPYTTGPLHRQLGSTWRKIFRLALPGRTRSQAYGTAA